MQRTKTLVSALFVVFSVALLCWSVRRTRIADDAALKLIPASGAKNAIDFTLPNAATRQPFHLRDQVKGGPLVLDFWATWCGPCREELPHLEKLSRTYQSRVAFYGVNSSDAPPQINAFAKQNGLTFPMLSDATRKVASLYGEEALPLLIVVDTRSRVRWVANFYEPNIEADLSRALDALLAEERKAN